MKIEALRTIQEVEFYNCRSKIYRFRNKISFDVNDDDERNIEEDRVSKTCP